MAVTNDEILRQVLLALQSTENLVKGVFEERTISAEKLSIVELKLGNVESNMNEILAIIRGTDGEGLQVKTKLLEKRISDLEKEVNTKYDEWLAIKVEGTKGRWVLLAAALTGFAGLLTSIVTAFVK